MEPRRLPKPTTSRLVHERSMKKGSSGMRSFILAIGAGLLAFVSASKLEAQTGLRIGHVNSETVLAEAPGATEAQEEFDRLTERGDQEIEEMDAELDSLIAAYQQRQSTLSPNIRQARETEINQLQQRNQQRLDQIGQELQQSRLTLFGPIVDQMYETIEAIREEGGYHLILEVASQIISAADASLDLTQEVLDRMQAAGVQGD